MEKGKPQLFILETQIRDFRVRIASHGRIEIVTLIKPETKLDEIITLINYWLLLKSQILSGVNNDQLSKVAAKTIVDIVNKQREKCPCKIVDVCRILYGSKMQLKNKGKVNGARCIIYFAITQAPQ